ncbi:MAG: AfsA-related hotdog domain-containing protein [bacterium]
MQQEKVYFIVGDRYNNFCRWEGVVTCSQLLKEIERGVIPAKRFIIGQGCDKEILDYLREKIDGIFQSKDIFIEENFSHRISHHLVHKTKPNNVLITFPVETKNGVFQSSLVIDGGCEDLSDHITGVHIQGTILIEASRQMYTAVSEIFLEKKYLKDTNNHHCSKYRFVLNEMNVSFHSFLFPLHVDIILTLQEVMVNKRGTIFNASALIESYQMRTLGSKVTCKGFGYPAEMLESFEGRQALVAYRNFVRGYSYGICLSET